MVSSSFISSDLPSLTNGFRLLMMVGLADRTFNSLEEFACWAFCEREHTPGTTAVQESTQASQVEDRDGDDGRTSGEEEDMWDEDAPVEFTIDGWSGNRDGL